MIEPRKLKPFFPLKNFEDVEKLFQYNIDENNGDPNLALLSIVAGLIENSLVNITDKDDLAANSRPVNHRKDAAQRGFTNAGNLADSSPHHLQHNHLTSTSEDVNKDHRQKHHNNNNHNLEFNEVGSITPSDESSYSSSSTPEVTVNDNLPIPEIKYEAVESLYKKFVDQFKNSIDFKDVELNKTNLKIKKISDSVWEHLSNSYYKDKAHLQSIFSYLTTSKLDCFGLAFAVIAGCQLLNLTNIYLALSEDHAWVMFDLHQDDYTKAQKDRELKEYNDNNLPIPTCAEHGTCEVTWHGKANSDKRGQPVTYKNCWLYTNGYAVKCDIRLCVAALVNSINPSINTNTDSEILALLQQRLLWLLFNHKIYFPMSLGNLGELENICPTPGAPLTPQELFNLGIEISRNQYNDAHVYPYSYLASFFFNHGRFKEALETWADSSAVMTKYNYSRDDEEIYKEFFEVANELIPSMLKVLTAGGLEPGRVSTKPFLQDPECLALILKFYDNICCWEEGSSTPVLHIGWAKNFVATILKFSWIIRSKIKLLTESEWNHNQACVADRELPSVESSEDRLKQEPEEAEASKTSDSKRSNETGRSRKRTHSINDDEEKVDTSESSNQRKAIKTEDSTSPAEGAISSGRESVCSGYKVAPVRERRLEMDSDNNVTVILKSRKIAGARDLLQAERLNKTAIELQLTAQSQCAVRGRSNSSSYSSDFISSALTTMSGSTRSKRLHR